ncbi:VOC family protein [Paenibacillus urinalis]|uniref:VOC family protein n=1 Tax=Paenibacillus urinalis TaxID=521520 RepID=A0ABY7XFR8_9BACL|nr:MULTISPECIES: VOC family protein [Paenibacillus]WDH96434.1 VOC family protein [Paenibacillus urinalis]WDI04657.1 VOC family protein [Paenibacillus urinalis]GAK40566.1 glyoxalase/bleomycin resistance protein/dioxygenase [Paenibacillus sp. TCA20]
MALQSKQIFVNLPVKNLNASIEFFSSIGFAFNEQFTDENATSMIISDQIYAMLLTEDRFKSFISKPVADAKAAAQVILCLSADSREQVDEIADKAIAAGGRSYSEPQDHGFMYGRSFEDLDGHLWEIMWMDPATVE